MQSKAKRKSGQAKTREQRRQKKQHKARRQSQGTAHGPRPRVRWQRPYRYGLQIPPAEGLGAGPLTGAV